MKNKKILLALIPVILVLTATNVLAVTDPASPPGCTADNSVVNIAKSTATAVVGQTITFTLDAGNPASGNGCDITNRVMTLTLPNNTNISFGPNNYPNPTALTFVGSVDYVAKKADLVGGSWVTTVSWTGIQKDGADSVSTGSKGVFVVYVPENLTVTKTANPVIEDRYTWTIDKSVTPATWNLFDGDTGTSEYTVAVVKTLSGTVNTVTGTITITNPSAFVSAHITGVADVISPSIGATVNCPVSFPYDLAAGAHIDCTYNATLSDTTTRINTATVTTTGDIGSKSGTAPVNFTGITPTVVGGSINVDDNNTGTTGPWAFSASGSVKYNKTFDCSGLTYTSGHASYSNVNTATIRGTALSDSATVNVDCYRPSVTKNATTTFDRKYTWTIDKVGSTSALTLNPGENATVNYDVTVNVASSIDSNWAVSGMITIHNPAPMAATINSVSDVITGALSATVNCGTTPFTIAAGSDKICTYSRALPDGTSRTNNATATQQNYNYDKNKVATTDGTKDYSGTASVAFGTPTNKVDECINVTDTFGGSLGTVCVGVDTLPKTFHYTRTVGPYVQAECGTPKNVDNTASFVTDDTDTTGNDSWRVVVTVPCPQLGCTLTPGYWKTHSSYGPAPSDLTWNKILPSGPDTTFFLSGQTWYQVMWTAPKGNAYYQLSFQYTAAVLNIFAGASVPSNVNTSLASAKTLFNTYTPAQIAVLKGSDSLRAQFISLAGILGSYNSGFIGPGHCDDKETAIV